MNTTLHLSLMLALAVAFPHRAAAQPQRLPPLTTTPPSTKLIQPLSSADFSALAKRCAPDAPLATLRSIVSVESAFQPYALSLNYASSIGRSLGTGPGSVVLARQPNTLAEALRWSRWFIANGISVSIGLMQVNSEHLTEAHVALERAFDPCWNLRLGWVIFNRKYHAAAAVLGRGQMAMHAALSAYNSGDTAAGFTNGYVKSILEAATAVGENAAEVIEPPDELPEGPRAGAPAAAAGGEHATPAEPATPTSPKPVTTRLPWSLERASAPWPPPRTAGDP